MSEHPLKGPLANIRSIALDLDGTVYTGNSLFEWSVPFLRLLDELNITYDFLTNNSSRNTHDYLVHLRHLGLKVHRDQVYTSGLATIEWLRKEHPEISRLFVLGTNSLAAEFRRSGFQLVDNSCDDPPEAVVVGFDTSLVYDRLCLAAYWIDRGKLFVATHPDLICPTDRATMLIDCGAICASLERATGRSPDAVIGKPDPRMLDGILHRRGITAEQLAMVGDRLYTDIAMANARGTLSVLVLSGEATTEDVAESDIQPDLIVANLAELGSLLRQCGPQRRSA